MEDSLFPPSPSSRNLSDWLVRSSRLTLRLASCFVCLISSSWMNVPAAAYRASHNFLPGQRLLPEADRAVARLAKQKRALPPPSCAPPYLYCDVWLADVPLTMEVHAFKRADLTEPVERTQARMQRGGQKTPVRGDCSPRLDQKFAAIGGAK